MASYNGLVASLTKGGEAGVTTLLSGVSSVTAVSAIPAKHFTHAQFALTATEGVSGTFGAEIYCYIGGATFMLAGLTNISAVGSYIFGATGTILTGYPRPGWVDFVSGKSNVDSGFTASVYMCGQY